MQHHHNSTTIPLTNRTTKISSTFSAFNPTSSTLQSNDELLSTRHSHRKYKLSHSQIDKIDRIEKISRDGLTRWKQKKEEPFQFIEDTNDNRRAFQHERINTCESVEEQSGKREIKVRESEQKSKKHSQQRNQTIHPIQNRNYTITHDDTLELSANISLRLQILRFTLPHHHSTHPSFLQVICFQIHDQQTDTHYRRQFTYSTLPEEVRFFFDNVEEVFQYVVPGQEGNDGLVRFCGEEMGLEVKVGFQRVKGNTRQEEGDKQTEKSKKKKSKWLKIQLLPFAVIEIFEHDHNQNSHQTHEIKPKENDKEKKSLQTTIDDFKNEISSQKSLIYALRSQNDKLKQKLTQQIKEVEKEKAEKQVLLESYEKMSKASEIPKEYFFQFVPDPKAKNYSHFSYKNNSIKKTKNDLKWDQFSSEAPLPKSNRHYFTFLIKTFVPDYMFGIVTLKGKDTPNAFLGLETICLYVSKNNAFVYERGRHYKIGGRVKMGDLLVVIVDRDRGLIEWMKKMGRSCGETEGNGGGNGKVACGQEEKPQQQKDPKSCITIDTHSLLTQPSSSCQQPLTHTRQLHNLHNITIPVTRQRKCSQSTINLSFQPSSLKIPTPFIDQPEQTYQFIHSTKIPEEMLTHELYAYVEVYNVDEVIRLNERK